MTRIFSGIQPSGELHIGNYLGAVKNWVALQQRFESFYCIVDYHAITVEYEPAALRERTRDMAISILASGVDPARSILFVQSAVPEHTELAWIFNSVAPLGELERQTQFKDKSSRQESIAVGLLTYPVLQAADILLYQADEVPVGADQRQHVELTRDLAQRFNTRFGDTFTLPRATLPEAGARVMDLQLVDKRMAKSVESPQGKILLGESEDETRRKVMRAVTDSGAEVRAAADKPGVSNLLDLMAAVTGTDIAALEAHFDGKGYGDFKREVAEAVNAYLRPVRSRYAELRTDPAMVEESLRKGAGKARAVAAETMEAVRDRVGLLPRA